MTAALPPLLVTGLPRTGTSWVGKMLEAGGEVVYVNEPLNPRHPPGRSPGVLDAEVSHQFQHICSDNEAGWLAAFQRTVALRYGFVRELRRNHRPYDLARMVKYGAAFTAGRWRGRRALLDDPFAIFALPWLVRRLGARAVVLVRDPVAVVGSYHKLGWRVRFDGILGQPTLLRDLVGADAAARLRAVPDDASDVYRGALLWRVVYSAVDQCYRQLPGVTVCRYEDLAREPVARFRAMYDFLGLRFTERAHARVVQATTGRGDQREAHRWTLRYGLSKTAFRPMDSRQAVESAGQRLSTADLSVVRGVTAAVAERFYPGHRLTGGLPASPVAGPVQSSEPER